MKIPLPCMFGESAGCNGKNLSFKGVAWFKWTRGMEYTYFFFTGNEWHPTDFYTTFSNDQPCFFEVPDSLLVDTFFKDRGYPLKGRGYADGISFLNGKTYVDFIITSNYFAHIKVQCDETGAYVPHGDIIFPPRWDTEEKTERAILKSYNFIKGDPLVVKAPEPRQITIFDFLKDQPS